MTDNNNDSSKTLKTEKINNPDRKFAWMDKYIKQTGNVARMEAKKNGTYIIYEKDGQLVKEYPDGKILPLKDKSQDE
ncbi:hypothetical protein [Radiobacillus deserti]|uniref:Uncharacterized protein n=1 Tax=Radiobacillus deserti TaxID=2594883 RepID=A0A516KKR8_9BACI|nr:hypothetical protein [Radiobacillus deserti]QDP41982.1 hypothetical protein FN924_18495 [Radiobacillus deserti]